MEVILRNIAEMSILLDYEIFVYLYPMKFFRHLRKGISLRIINFVGLSIMFACMLLSAGYIKRERSYDRHHTHIDRIVRMTIQFNNEPIDGRVVGNTVYPILQQIPEIEQVVKMNNIHTAVLTHQGARRVVNNFYAVSRDFLHLFDITLLHGQKEEALQQRGQAIISESFARQLFGEIDPPERFQASPLHIGGRQFRDTVFVSGIYKDMPQTSHFNTDILVHLPDEINVYAYVYLLLKEHTDIDALAQKITGLFREVESYRSENARILLTPLADIHLHSRNLREMSVNGNIHYVYLLLGANILLLIVVLFNLWLNASLIFSHHRRYYQLLRLHGAPSSKVFKDEAMSATLLGVLSIATGTSVAFCLLSFGGMAVDISLLLTIVLCLLFLSLVIAISLIPALKGMATTLFLHTGNHLKPLRFSYANVKYMLTAQYAVLMVVTIVAFGINKQMNMVKDTQVGGNRQNILVMGEQPDQVLEKYALLKSELLKHTQIEAVTACFQLPGNAIRDAVNVKKEGDSDWIQLPVIVAGEDFLPFFRIQMIAGAGFSPGKHDYQTEDTLLFNRLVRGTYSEHIEEYIINQKALAMLGFGTPEESIGKILQLNHGGLDYFARGTIVGVSADFNYTGLYEETQPLLILQRNMFLHCIMVQLNPNDFLQARIVVEKVWNEVNPDYPAHYVFMNDVFGKMYRNEMNAQRLVYLFTLLCFIVADLGLIVFMAFIIRRRTKEVGIRKVHGASIVEVIWMLNIFSIRYIALAFALAAPIGWYIMHRWLERFAYRTSLDWWIFALAGLCVLLVSIASVSMQSWRAANQNPAEVLKFDL